MSPSSNDRTNDTTTGDTTTGDTTRSDPGTSDPGFDEDRRARGLELMREVYGWDLPVVEGDFVELTVDHLFARIWDRPGFTVAERRLVLIGLLVGQGLDDVLGIQLDAALRLDELDADQLRELVIFLSHYAGWPRGAKLNSQVETLIAKASTSAKEQSS